MTKQKYGATPNKKQQEVTVASAIGLVVAVMVAGGIFGAVIACAVNAGVL